MHALPLSRAHTAAALPGEIRQEREKRQQPIARVCTEPVIIYAIYVYVCTHRGCCCSRARTQQKGPRCCWLSSSFCMEYIVYYIYCATVKACSGGDVYETTTTAPPVFLRCSIRESLTVHIYIQRVNRAGANRSRSCTLASSSSSFLSVPRSASSSVTLTNLYNPLSLSYAHCILCYILAHKTARRRGKTKITVRSRSE